MRDNEFKVWCRESGLLKEYRKARYQAFLNGTSVKDFIPFDDELENDLKKEYDAVNSKRSRAGKRLLCMFVSAVNDNKNIAFITFTFKNSALESTSLKTRREYLTRTLRRADDYIANIDFGEQNGREHFHAIAIGYEDFKQWEDKLGFVRVDQIHLNDDPDYEITKSDNKKASYDFANLTRLKKYLVKYENHATKDSVQASRIISKRGVHYPWWYYESFETHISRLLKRAHKEHDIDRIQMLESKANKINLQIGDDEV